MRGLRNIINQFRHIKGNTTFIAVAFGIALGLFGIAGALTQSQANAASANDIVYGGIYNRDLASKCSGDVRTIMDHYRIDCNLAGVVDGRACKDNNVYVGDRIVARDAQSIGRQQKPGDHAISIGGQTYWEAPNSVAFAQQCIDAFVKLDQNGSFVYAILKPCGNPIWTPSPVVVPPPEQPKNIKVCLLSNKTIITIRESDYNSQIHSKNLADCKEKKIQVCLLSNKTIITINEKDFDSDLHSKNLADCKEKPQHIIVCELATKKTITIDEKDFNSQLHSRNLDDCKDKEKYIDVCDLKSRKIVTINEKDYNPQIHSKNPADCEVCPYNSNLPKTSVDCVPPVALPQTGPGDTLLGAGLGIGSTILAASFYVASRRDLLSAFLTR